MKRSVVSSCRRRFTYRLDGKGRVSETTHNSMGRRGEVIPAPNVSIVAAVVATIVDVCTIFSSFRVLRLINYSGGGAAAGEDGQVTRDRHR